MCVRVTEANLQASGMGEYVCRYVVSMVVSKYRAVGVGEALLSE